MKNLRLFKTETEYNAFIQSENFIIPNVSYAIDTDTVFYNIVKTESGDYKIILLEKKNISGLTYNMVDLGLPSGTLWADRNVGASAPEDFGTYFAWGETEGYNASVKYCTAEELISYLYPDFAGSIDGVPVTITPENLDEILTERNVIEKDLSTIGMGVGTNNCFVTDYSNYFDTTDGGYTFNKYDKNKLTVLQPEDDAATVNMGSEYRMPTIEECNELMMNSILTIVDRQGNEYSLNDPNAGNVQINYNFKGLKVTGPNGNSIFLPSAGNYSTDYYMHEQYGKFYNSGLNLFYGANIWTSNLHDKLSYKACDLNTGNMAITNYERCYGLSVRGIK